MTIDKDVKLILKPPSYVGGFYLYLYLLYMKQNIINEIDTIRKMMGVISEKSENENLIEDLLEFEGFYDLDIMYSKSYYPGNGPLTHVLEMYFVKKDGEYARYNSGNAITVRLYFRVRNNEPYLVEMSQLQEASWV